jgi:predicted translin family RNA/ssDNA-binding protein
MDKSPPKRDPTMSRAKQSNALSTAEQKIDAIQQEIAALRSRLAKAHDERREARRALNVLNELDEARILRRRLDEVGCTEIDQLDELLAAAKSGGWKTA